MIQMNLNRTELLEDHDALPLDEIRPRHASSEDGMTEVYFDLIEEALLDEIHGSMAVVGCVAWLTSQRILDQLAMCAGGVSIVVQKEDFLRPDFGDCRSRSWRLGLRKSYEKLHPLPGRYTAGDLVSSLSTASSSHIDPVRCVGNHNSTKMPAFPRMHHKFAVFCEVLEHHDPSSSCLRPFKVWTGSFNFTKNATMSLENAIVSSDPQLVKAYFREWEHILALSEPLDWTSEWSAPEWRIGT